MKRPFLLIFLLIISLIVATIQATKADDKHSVYLPYVVTPPLDCNVPDTVYGSFPIVPPPTDRPAEVHGDINLALRGYTETTAVLTLQDVDGGTDPNAPQLDGLFSPNRLPIFTTAYQAHHWDWGCNCRGDAISDPEVTHLGMGVDIGEIIYVPDSGYDIGGGNEVLILYATDERITLKYTGEDNVVFGYTLHIENICVEPDLVELYETWNMAGRSQLPALPAGSAIGRALGSEISISIRDTGVFKDPRTQKDWWKEY